MSLNAIIWCHSLYSLKYPIIFQDQIHKETHSQSTTIPDLPQLLLQHIQQHNPLNNTITFQYNLSNVCYTHHMHNQRFCRLFCMNGQVAF